MSNTKITVDELMAAVQAEARAAPSEPPFPLLRFGELVPELRERSSVNSSPELIGRTAYERLWVLINRLLRRGASPAVAPVVVQQNEWNAAVFDTLTELAALAATLQADVSRLHAERHER